MSSSPHFPPGDVCITPECNDYLEAKGISPISLLTRHLSLENSEMTIEDQQANREAIATGDRIFSRYTIEQVKVFIVTEADRSITTIMLANEY